MEISVKFNGQSPRINSLIEKYQGIPLQDWISIIPKIFHDEMNGYDFELDFSGTELDCEEIKTASRKAKISVDEVPIFLKNELESREIKADNINLLLSWLKKIQTGNLIMRVFVKSIMNSLTKTIHISPFTIPQNIVR